MIHTEQAVPGKVSMTADGWSANMMKMEFLGMTGHWIDMKDGKWKLRVEVIGFRGLSGAHSGANLERYAVGLLDCVEIMDKDQSKVCVRHPKSETQVLSIETKKED